jgi:type VI protein secretion system component VasK
MPDGAEVIEAAQVGAAETVAAEVAQTVAITDGLIAAEVGAVGERLAEHAAQSEERHEEILEETEVCQDAQQLLMAQVTGLQSSLLSFQQSTQATQAAMLAELQTLNARLSTDSRQLNQQTPPPEEPPVVAPESAGADRQEVPPPVAKRRVRPI